ncbi:response regulator [Candidatus Pacearchaeota archaeon]|nr:response regulator [Candidatus Pacearchaeota archaeon]
MKKVLIVGPCYADAQSLKKSLGSEFSTSIMDVTKAEEAKNILRQRKIDLILISKFLVGDKSPGMEFLSYIKENNPEIPVVLLTRFPETQKEALEKGAAASFDMDLLIGYIRPSMVQKNEEALKVLKKYLN